MFSTHPEIEGLTLFAAEPGLHVHEVHSHGAHSVIVVTGGAKTFHHSGRSVRVEAGEMAISNPGDLHGCEPADGAPWSHRTWYIDPALMAELAGGAAVGETRLAAPRIRDAALAERLNAAHAEAREGDILDRQSVAMEALRDLVAAHGSSQGVNGDGSGEGEAEDGAAAQARLATYDRVFADTLPGPVTLAQLAAPAGVSRNQVIRDFRAVRGTTPGAYGRHLRLEDAKARLRDGARLAEVSALAGFADQSHFTRVFRRAYGVTPDAYRRVLDGADGLAV